jgi:hypothetical protein
MGGRRAAGGGVITDMTDELPYYNIRTSSGGGTSCTCICLSVFAWILSMPQIRIRHYIVALFTVIIVVIFSR